MVLNMRMTIVRWILLLPAVLASEFIISAVVYNLQYALGLFSPALALSRHALSWLLGFGIGYWLTPGNKSTKFKVLFVIYLLWLVVIMVQLIFQKAGGLRLDAALIELLGITLGASLVYRFNLKTATRRG